MQNVQNGVSSHNMTLDYNGQPINPKELTNYEQIREFHRTYQVVIPEKPILRDLETRALGLRLIEEELDEVRRASDPDNKDYGMCNLAKELGDLLYVVYAMGSFYGLPMDEVFARVHHSNMSKLGEDGKPIRRDDGKVLKGPNYREPDLSFLLSENTLADARRTLLTE